MTLRMSSYHTAMSFEAGIENNAVVCYYTPLHRALILSRARVLIRHSQGTLSFASRDTDKQRTILPSMDGIDKRDLSMSTSLWGEFKPYSGIFLMRGYSPLGGGLLDDASPLVWTRVHVELREPNLVVMRELDSNIDSTTSMSMSGSEDTSPTLTAGLQLTTGGYKQEVRLDKNTNVTEIKKKNYSTDPSKTIFLEAFSIEKSKDWGILPFEGIMYKRIKFGVIPTQIERLEELRNHILAICEKVREVPDEIPSGGLFSGLLGRTSGYGKAF